MNIVDVMRSRVEFRQSAGRVSRRGLKQRDDLSLRECLHSVRIVAMQPQIFVDKCPFELSLRIFHRVNSHIVVVHINLPITRQSRHESFGFDELSTSQTPIFSDQSNYEAAYRLARSG